MLPGLGGASCPKFYAADFAKAKSGSQGGDGQDRAIAAVSQLRHPRAAAVKRTVRRVGRPPPAELLKLDGAPP